MSQSTSRAEPVLPPAANETPPDEIARHLLRSGLTAALATVGADGAPYASMVAYATRQDGAPLFLFSGLSAHTRNLVRDPRFSLLIAEPPNAEGDPMDSARVTLSGRIARSDEPADRARYLRRHASAELYAGLADFKIHAGTVLDAHLVAGFGRARGLPVAAVRTEPAPALAEAEAGIVAHMNEDHADAINLYATRLLGLPEDAWRMTGIDPEGCDLRAANRTARLLFDRRIEDAGAARQVLVDLVKRARA